jgi:hypothetical protein
LPESRARHRGAQRSTAWLPGDGDRARFMANARRADASTRRFEFCRAIGALEEFRPAMGSLFQLFGSRVRRDATCRRKLVEDRAKPESDPATSRARSDDATPREEDIIAQ